MELKLRKTNFSFNKITYSFNRTFMELKLIGHGKIAERTASFNRTFMELKYRQQNGGSEGSPVLIVPLWN